MPANSPIGGWHYLNVPLDTTRAGAAMVLDPSGSGRMLIYGGKEIGGGPLDTAGTADPNSSWQAVAPMSVARAFHGYARDGGRAFAIGGIDDQDNVLTSTEYFSADGKWKSAASMPSARWAFPAVDDGAGHIYIFGGGTTSVSNSVSKTVYVYNVATNTWASAASMPVATRESAAALGPDGNIYVVGGLEGSGVNSTVQVYNLAAKHWSLGVSLPLAVRSEAAAIDADGHLLVLGGIDAAGHAVANVWSTQELNEPDTIPAFTSSPVTSGKALQRYSYQATAEANPQAVFSLITSPPGLAVNHATGLVTWIPGANQTGLQKATLRASNRMGGSNQSFSIRVLGAPPSAPTGLAQTGAQTDSISLKWNASAVPGGAPVFYRILWTYCRSGRGGGCTTLTLADKLTTTAATITGLRAGHSYTLTVAAVANSQVVDGSSVSATTKSIAAPTGLAASDIASTSAKLSWTFTHGIGITGFKIIHLHLPASTVLKVVGAVSSTTITGLRRGTSYTLYMSAFDARGNQSYASRTVTFKTLK